MAKSTKETKKQTRRTQVKELPKKEKELSADEQNDVKGGAGAFFFVDIAAKPKQ